MNTYSALDEEELKDILKGENNLIIGVINYEERSLKMLKLIHEMQASLLPEQISLCIIELTAGGYSIDVLGALKDRHLARARELCGPFVENDQRQLQIEKIKYPSTEDKVKLKRTIRGWLATYADAVDQFNVIVDISCLPKSIMYEIIEQVSAYWETNSHINDVLVTYTSAGWYPQTQYEQVVGIPQTYLEEDDLHAILANNDKVEAILIPGFEASPLISTFDALDGSRSEIRILFFIEGSRFRRTMRAMRANQLLLHKAYRSDKCYVNYCFSYADGMEYISRAAAEFTPAKRKLLLFAPAGPKPFTLASYLACKDLRRRGANADLVHVAGFQYTSVYSVGEGEISTFRLPIPNRISHATKSSL